MFKNIPGLAKKRLGYYVLVEFSDEAKRVSIGHDFMKKLVHYRDGKIVFIEDYADYKVKRLKRHDIVVVDTTIGQLVPKDSALKSELEEAFRNISITRRL